MVVSVTVSSTAQPALGRAIRHRREAQGIPREALALAVGRSAESIAGWECGHFSPRLPTLIRLAEVLGCSVSELLEDQP